MDEFSFPRWFVGSLDDIRPKNWCLSETYCKYLRGEEVKWDRNYFNSMVMKLSQGLKTSKDKLILYYFVILFIYIYILCYSIYTHIYILCYSIYTHIYILCYSIYTYIYILCYSIYILNA